MACGYLRTEKNRNKKSSRVFTLKWTEFFLRVLLALVESGQNLQFRSELYDGRCSKQQPTEVYFKWVPVSHYWIIVNYLVSWKWAASYSSLTPLLSGSPTFFSPIITSSRKYCARSALSILKINPFITIHIFIFLTFEFNHSTSMMRCLFVIRQIAWRVLLFFSLSLFCEIN